MTAADFLKLRKKRGSVIWALVLALAPLLIYFIVSAVQHSSNPAQHAPAGGINGFTDGMPHHRPLLRPARGDPDRRRRPAPATPPRACSGTSW